MGSRQPVDKAHSRCSPEGVESMWAERTHSPDTRGAVGILDRPGSPLSAAHIPALAPAMMAALEMFLEKADSLVFVRIPVVVPEKLPARAHVPVLVPGTLERRGGVHLQAETAVLLMDERAKRPSHVLDA